ncbi:hypothetical protein CAOG_08897 [Capsaspora owczarzaki ATCC 30864]|uniref:G-patch domain-containing protein n=1 Tax=Capsaspora owczarzaki (strain ATCC 30864) TaxID=595528 RepID=A0A0D2WS79_CAPO3|nr:hypothetical protein CAOG_08897 [Capsaspora owczarzaki ATCC 30864]KJE94955.1 hypothetical protein CAOG_008897 [Capsaspora owczarzaki ATCC 30864]|eukprot:XP_011270559.1 hypothetical protein CAOG_08897 [Capsaspora owczarzaki ATCC 30864]
MGYDILFRPLRGIRTTLAKFPKELHHAIFDYQGCHIPGSKLLCWPLERGELSEYDDDHAKEVAVLVGHHEAERFITRCGEYQPNQILHSFKIASDKDWDKFVKHLPPYLHGERESFADYSLLECLIRIFVLNVLDGQPSVTVMALTGRLLNMKINARKKPARLTALVITALAAVTLLAFVSKAQAAPACGTGAVCTCAPAFAYTIVTCSTTMPTSFPNDAISIGLTDLAVLELRNLPSLTALPNSFLVNMPSVSRLVIETTGINSIGPNVFSGAPSTLTTLPAKLKSRISSVGPSLLATMTNLRTLQISSPNLNSINVFAFQNNPLLQQLVLSENPALLELPFTYVEYPSGFVTFQSLLENQNNLQLLDLSYTGLLTIPPNLISYRPQLQNVTFAYSSISSIGSVEITNMPQLKYLNLAQNSITNVHVQAFTNLPSLLQLQVDLSRNGITSFPAGVFSGLQSLTDLYLFTNSATTLPPGLFQWIATLQDVRLGSNPFTVVPPSTYGSTTTPVACYYSCATCWGAGPARCCGEGCLTCTSTNQCTSCYNGYVSQGQFCLPPSAISASTASAKSTIAASSASLASAASTVSASGASLASASIASAAFVASTSAASVATAATASAATASAATAATASAATASAVSIASVATASAVSIASAATVSVASIASVATASAAAVVSAATLASAATVASIASASAASSASTAVASAASVASENAASASSASFAWATSAASIAAGQGDESSSSTPIIIGAVLGSLVLLLLLILAIVVARRRRSAKPIRKGPEEANTIGMVLTSAHLLKAAEAASYDVLVPPTSSHVANPIFNPHAPSSAVIYANGDGPLPTDGPVYAEATLPISTKTALPAGDTTTYTNVVVAPASDTTALTMMDDDDQPNMVSFGLSDADLAGSSGRQHRPRHRGFSKEQAMLGVFADDDDDNDNNDGDDGQTSKKKKKKRGGLVEDSDVDDSDNDQNEDGDNDFDGDLGFDGYARPRLGSRTSRHRAGGRFKDDDDDDDDDAPLSLGRTTYVRGALQTNKTSRDDGEDDGEDDEDDDDAGNGRAGLGLGFNAFGAKPGAAAGWTSGGTAGAASSSADPVVRTHAAPSAGAMRGGLGFGAPAGLGSSSSSSSASASASKGKKDNAQPQIATWEKFTKGIGSKLLKKYGYVEGAGLGNAGEGMAVPLDVQKRQGKTLGLGFLPELSDQQREEEKRRAKMRGQPGADSESDDDSARSSKGKRAGSRPAEEDDEISAATREMLAQEAEFEDAEERGEQPRSRKQRRPAEPHWKKGAQRQSMPPRTATQIIANYAGSGSQQQQQQQQQQQVIVDLRGAQPVVLTNLAQGQMQTSEYGADGAPSLSGQMPELQYNIKTMVDTFATELESFASKVPMEQAHLHRLAQEHKSLAALHAEDQHTMERVREISEILARCHARVNTLSSVSNNGSVLEAFAGSKGPATTNLVLSVFHMLRDSFPEEYRLFNLARIALSYATPAVSAILNDWRLFGDDAVKNADSSLSSDTDPTSSSYGVDLVRSWKQLLNLPPTRPSSSSDLDAVEQSLFGRSHSSAQQSQQQQQQQQHQQQVTPYDRLMWEVWVPHLRTSLMRWSPRTSSLEHTERLVRALTAWSDLIPEWIGENLCDQLLVPRLIADVENWNPVRDTVPIHSWLFPFLPLLGMGRLGVALRTIRFKLSNALAEWTPDDESALAVLSPWRTVMPAGDFGVFLIRSIVPKLSQAIREMPVDPANQRTVEPVVWLARWVDAFHGNLEPLVGVLERELFPRWHQALTAWLASDGNYDEIAEWYLGWRALLPKAIRDHPAISAQLTVALDAVNHKIDPSRPAPAQAAQARARMAQQQQQLEQKRKMTAPAYSTLASQEASFRDLLESLAAQHGLLFMPAQGRRQDGNQVYQFGRALCYIDRAVVFVSDGGRWMPTAVSELVAMAS